MFVRRTSRQFSDVKTEASIDVAQTQPGRSINNRVEIRVDCPAPFVPAAMRETCMSGTLNRAVKEAYAGAIVSLFLQVEVAVASSK